MYAVGDWVHAKPVNTNGRRGKEESLGTQTRYQTIAAYLRLGLYYGRRSSVIPPKKQEPPADDRMLYIPHSSAVASL